MSEATGLHPYHSRWEDADFNERWAVVEARRKAGHKQPDGVIRADVSLEFQTSFRIDLPGLILANLDLYWSEQIMDAHDCVEEWQRPEALVWEILTEDGVELWGQQRNASHIKGFGFDVPEINFRWSEVDFNELITLHPELDPERQTERVEECVGQEALL